MKDRVGNGGFTLIELLIVVAIIAILAAIAVPNGAWWLWLPKRSGAPATWYTFPPPSPEP